MSASESKSFTVRKNVNSLSDDELSSLRAAYQELMSLKDNRGYNYLAGIHGIPLMNCWHGPKNIDNVFKARLFLPWHRAYLYKFEKALQDAARQVPGLQDAALMITLPYWDWRTDAGSPTQIPEAFSSQTAGTQANPLFKSRIDVDVASTSIHRDTIRFPGENVGFSLPSVSDVDQVLTETKFDYFSDHLENTHNRVHSWTGGMRLVDGQQESGDMGLIPQAAYDPIFWSHHAMIDRLWWQWQQANGVQNIPADYLDLGLEPFGMAVKDVVDIYGLGYDYAASESSVEGTAAAAQ